MLLRRKLARATSRAIADFDMIADGDRILCAVSGGKDSYAMHALLVDLARRAPVQFTVIAVNIDQGTVETPDNPPVHVGKSAVLVNIADINQPITPTIALRPSISPRALSKASRSPVLARASFSLSV